MRHRTISYHWGLIFLICGVTFYVILPDQGQFYPPLLLDTIEPSELASYNESGQHVNICGAIDQILNNDLVIGRKTRVTIKNYQSYSRNNKIETGARVQIRGKIEKDGSDVYMLVVEKSWFYPEIKIQNQVNSTGQP
jgi:hypothetical protein